jgi:hypothetical protein
MKRFRLLHVALLLFFAAIVVGVQFHSHAPGQDRLTAHCNSCLVSQAAYDHVDANVVSISEIAVPYQAPNLIVAASVETVDARSSRAPPAC